MKGLLSVLVFTLLVIPLFLSPAAANASANEVVTTLAVTDVAYQSATFHGTVTGGKRSFDTYFEYGTSRTSLTKKTPTKTYVGVASITLNAIVEGLSQCTDYYVRLVVRVGADGQAAVINGSIVNFKTMGCGIQYGQNTIPGTSSSATPYSASQARPAQMANILVQKAEIVTAKVAPGQKVDITASVTNQGDANGDARIALFVNGQEMDSQGVTLASGQTSPVHFYVTMNEPGTYTVLVGNVSAGSFTVDYMASDNTVLFISLGFIGLVLVVGAMYFLRRKQPAH
jgi:hypothetical protein